MSPIFRSMGDKAEVTPWGFMQHLWQHRKWPRNPPPHPHTAGWIHNRDPILLSGQHPWAQLCPAVPSGEEMVEERGVPVHEDWSMAPDDDRVRFSLSGVAPHSCEKSPWEGWWMLGKDGSVSLRHF